MAVPRMPRVSKTLYMLRTSWSQSLAGTDLRLLEARVLVLAADGGQAAVLDGQVRAEDEFQSHLKPWAV